MDPNRKAIYVAGGHLTDHPLYVTYTSVIGHDSVLLAFINTWLKILYILAGDIQSAYLNAPTREKIFFYAGDSWKSDQEKAVIIVRYLYGLNSSSLE